MTRASCFVSIHFNCPPFCDVNQINLWHQSIYTSHMHLVLSVHMKSSLSVPLAQVVIKGRELIEVVLPKLVFLHNCQDLL